MLKVTSLTASTSRDRRRTRLPSAARRPGSRSGTLNVLPRSFTWTAGSVTPATVPDHPAGTRAGFPLWQHGPVTLKAFRIVCALIFVGGIVTMIVTSIASNNMGVMITTGLVTAVAAIVLLAVSSAVQGKPFGGSSTTSRPSAWSGASTSWSPRRRRRRAEVARAGQRPPRPRLVGLGRIDLPAMAL